MSKFSIAGNVHPTEYDWKKQFSSCARICSKTGEVERVFDVGKVLGLAGYAEELEIKLSAAEKERSIFLAEHDENVRLHFENVGLKEKLAVAVEALEEISKLEPTAAREASEALKAINGGE